MKLKLYVDRLSPPSRSILIFCKVNGIEFEEVTIQMEKRQQLSSEYAEINPMKKIPTIIHGDFKLFESHAILIYLASAFPGVADHWYPANERQRAKIQLVLDWHHSNLRRGGFAYGFNKIIAPLFGLPSNQTLAAQGEKHLSVSLATIESVWLQGDGPFLHGNHLPSIADLSLVCEIMELEVLDEHDRERILDRHKKILKWMEDTRNATAPHFDEIHSFLLSFKEKLKNLKSKL